MSFRDLTVKLSGQAITLSGSLRWTTAAISARGGNLRRGLGSCLVNIRPAANLGLAGLEANHYLRRQMIHGARAIVSRLANHDDRRSTWLKGLISRRGFNRTIVALAPRQQNGAYRASQPRRSFRVAAILPGQPWRWPSRWWKYAGRSWWPPPAGSFRANRLPQAARPPNNLGHA